MPYYPLTFQEASERIHYDPETGALRWLVDHPYAKAGTFAGTILPNGYVAVTFNGQRIPGHYMAWLLHTGEWPKERIKLRSACQPGLDEEEKRARRSNLRFENLALASELLSQKPASQRRRHYARQKARALREEAVYRSVVSPTTYPNVTFDKERRLWLVARLYSFAEEQSGAHLVWHPGAPFDTIAEFPTQYEAENYAHELLVNRKLIMDTRTGEDLPPEPLPPGTGQVTAGFSGPTLNELYLALAYVRDEGRLFWRTGDRRYQPAPVPTKGRTSYIPVRNLRLPAHSTAFFLATGIWPLRGTLHPANGNWRDLTFRNLVYDRADMTTYPLEGHQW